MESRLEYNKKDFESLLLNVYEYSLGTDLKKVFPIFDKYREFKVRTKGLKNELLLRYIVYAFDRNSPLLVIPDILERRTEAALLAGFSPDKKSGNWSEAVDKMLKSIVPEVNHMVVRYCLLTGDTTYSIIVTYEDALMKELSALLNWTEDSGPTKGAVIGNINKLKQELSVLKQDFFNSNLDSFLSRSLTEFGEAKLINLSPEYYAHKVKNWNNVSRYYEESNYSSVSEANIKELNS